MSYFKPISISLSPNVEKDDVKLALNLIIRPWLWRKGKKPFLHSAECKNGNAIEKLESEFKEFLGVKYAVSFNSGRSAFYAILEALSGAEGLRAGQKVLLQAFTCNAAINPVLWANLKPIYVDAD
ncbi:MAG: DegT/DnrJ/EryC1/StrS family aminotransferase, partial [bacterium]